MLRCATTSSTSRVLLDFLAPTLISRAYSSSSSRPVRQANKLQGHDNPTIFDALKRQVAIQSSGERDLSSPQTQTFNSIVFRIRQALKDNNIHAVTEYWRYLNQNKLLRFLGPSQIEAISNLVTECFLPTHSEEWHLANRTLVEDIALIAAAGRSTDSLNACMLYHIRHNDPEAVIDLYQRFTTSLGKKEGLGDNGSKHTDILTADIAPNKAMVPHIPGRICILLAVTTAHAIRNSFQTALQTCLMTDIRFHPFTTQEFLKNLDYDPALQQKTKIYVQRLDIARMVSRPPSLSKQITNLSKGRALVPLEKLYRAIIDGLSGKDAYLAADPSMITPTKSIALTEVGWTSFMVAFLKCQRRDLGAEIWDDMTRFGVPHGVSLWTALLDAYDSIRAVDEAVAGWKMMHLEGVKPEGLTYRAMISALFNGRRPDEAMQIFQTFQENHLKDCPADQSLSVHNTVLHGLLASDRVESAYIMMKDMQENGPTPDIVSYNTFLAYHGRRSDFKALAAFVDKMTSVDLAGDVFSFSTILSALLKAGREDAPDLVLGIMRKQGIKPNVATFSAIIDQQMREGDEKNLQAALRLLQQMEQDPDTSPNEVTYTSVLAGLYRGHWLSPEKAEEWRRDIIGRMKKRDMFLNLPTYHILLKACLDYPHPEGLENALAYFQEMKRRKIILAKTTWYILLAGLLQRGEWGIAGEIVKEMYKSGYQPSGAVLGLVSKIRKDGGQTRRQRP